MLGQYTYALKPAHSERLRTQFASLDQEQTGFVNYIEATQIFSEFFEATIETTKLLFGLFQQNQVNVQQLEQLLAFLLCCNQAVPGEVKQLNAAQIKAGLDELYLNFSERLVDKMLRKFSQNQTATRAEFLEICATCILARKLFTEWDHQEKGVVEVGLEQIIEIALLFM